MNQQEIFEKQLALDYSCSIEQVRSKEHVFTRKEYREGRRIFKGDDCLMKVVCVNGKIIVSAEEEILDWCKTEWKDASSAWFFTIENLRKLDDKLRSMGHYLKDAHHFYLPGGIETIGDTIPGGADAKLRWYEQADLEQFRENNPFKEALSFLPEAPDMLAVTVEKDGVILGMAGASADGDKMWQIGINVTTAGEGMGMGTFLVTQLKRELIKRDIVPFYGTAESHIKSQRVAVQSGFMPRWAELYSEKRMLGQCD